MEDDLMRLFGGERMKSLMNRLGIPDDQPVEAKMVSRSIEQAQKKIEGLNFDTRKNVLEYDDVLNLQRTKIYKMRREYLNGQNETGGPGTKQQFLDLIHDEIDQIVDNVFAVQENPQEALQEITKQVGAIYQLPDDISSRLQSALENAADREFAVADALQQAAAGLMEAKEQEIGKETFDQVMSFIALQAVDMLWMEHLDTMDHLRDSVRLRGYGQRDPLVEYKKEAHGMFQRLMTDINTQITHSVLKVGVQMEQHDGHQHMNISTEPAAQQAQNPAQSTSAPMPEDPHLAGVGRNEPCPCGSGKKFKKCGLLNTPEHQQLMAAKT
jgi:preprotein translocase subunit SecA